METEGNNNLYQAPFEALRLILSEEQSRTITYEEALEIGSSLLEFFEVLSEDD